MTATTLAPPKIGACPKCGGTPATNHAGLWQCPECNLQAIDLANAVCYVDRLGPIGRPGRVHDQLIRQVVNGRRVDPMRLARAVGGTWSDDHRKMLSAISFDITAQVIEGLPWAIEPPSVVAEMILAALRAGKYVVVDVVDDDADVLGLGCGDRAELILDDSTAEAIGRGAAFGWEHATRDDAAVAVLAAMVDVLRCRPGDFGRTDGDHADALMAALEAAGFALIRATWLHGDLRAAA